MHRKILKQVDMETIKPVDDPRIEHPPVQVLASKWEFTRVSPAAGKKDDEGEPITHQARWYMRGDQQVLTFLKTHSPTARTHLIFMLIAIATAMAFTLETFDVKGAYLHSEIKETVYVKGFPGFQYTSR